MTPTSSQETAFNRLVEFIEEEFFYHFKLSGAAGSGKSYLVSEFIKFTQANHTYKIIALAPSHKAKNNLQQMFLDNGVEDLTVITVASFLGLAPVIDDATGKEIFASNDTKRAFDPKEFDLIICDEGWMLDRKTIHAIDDKKNAQAKLIFVGDYAQLPPIEDEISYLELPETGHYSESHLDEVVRYSGDLARVAHSLRVSFAIVNDKPMVIPPIAPMPVAQTQDKSIEQLSHNKFIYQLASEIACGNDSKLIAYTNKACQEWNQIVRRELRSLGYYGENKFDVYSIGDKLICKKPIERFVTIRDEYGNRIKACNQIIFENGIEFKVAKDPSYESETIDGTRLYYWKIYIDKKVEGTPDFYLKILCNDSEKDLDVLLDGLSKKAKAATYKGRWKQYYYAKNFFDDVSLAYAITCHKAQGSTLYATYLDLPNLSKCPSKYQILYTALTRAKQAYIF